MDVNIGLKRAFRPRTGDRALEGPARSEAQKQSVVKHICQRSIPSTMTVRRQPGG